MNTVSTMPQHMAHPSAAFADDEARLRVLESYYADALEDDPELCAIVQFAAKLCNVPVAQITLIERERQRFLVREGIEERETPRSMAFCAHTMLLSEILEVGDASVSPFFSDNPLVTGAPYVRYYAGYPLVSDDGAPLGALCVVDLEAHAEPLTDFQREGMAVLAQAVMRRLSAHRESVVAGKSLAEREAWLHTLADSMPAFVWSADGQGNIDYFNKRHHNFVGKDFVNGGIHPDDWERTKRTWEKALADGTEFEVELRVRQPDGEYIWVLGRAVPARDSDGKIARWFGTAVDIDEVHRNSDSRALLANELSHRIKNIFAVITGLISLKARKTPEHKQFADDVNKTLMALSRAQDFVRPAGGETRTSLRGLLEVLFVPYAADGQSRVHLSGDDASISPRSATPLALVFHELATNSAKYGALSESGGYVTLELCDSGETLQLLWREHGGPRLAINPEKITAGFGTRLVELTVSGQLGGSWQRHFDEDGLRVELVIAKQTIAP